MQILPRAKISRDFKFHIYVSGIWRFCMQRRGWTCRDRLLTVCGFLLVLSVCCLFWICLLLLRCCYCFLLVCWFLLYWGWYFFDRRSSQPPWPVQTCERWRILLTVNRTFYMSVTGLLLFCSVSTARSCKTSNCPYSKQTDARTPWLKQLALSARDWSTDGPARQAQCRLSSRQKPPLEERKAARGETETNIYILGFETQAVTLGTATSDPASLSSLHRAAGEMESGVRFPPFYGGPFTLAALLFYFWCGIATYDHFYGGVISMSKQGLAGPSLWAGVASRQCWLQGWLVIGFLSPVKRTGSLRDGRARAGLWT